MTSGGTPVACRLQEDGEDQRGTGIARGELFKGPGFDDGYCFTEDEGYRFLCACSFWFIPFSCNIWRVRISEVVLVLGISGDHEDVRGSGIVNLGIRRRRVVSLTHRPLYLRREESSPYQPNSTLGGPQNWSGYSEEENPLLHLMAIEPQFNGFPDSSLINVPTWLLRLLFAITLV